MPDNSENPNTYNFNLKRPQEGNNINTDPIDHTSTQKVADTAAKEAAEYFAPGVGGKVYDTAKKVPVVGDAINETTGMVAEVADKVPGVKKIAENLDKSGVTDAVNSGIDLANANKVNVGNSFNKKMGNTSDSSTNANTIRNFRKNGQFNSLASDEEELDSGNNNIENETAADEELIDNSVISQITEVNNFDNVSKDLRDLDDYTNNTSKNSVAGDILDDFAKGFLKKHKWIIIGIGAGIFFLILILFLIIGGGIEDMQNLGGYYDTACNYNDTKVTVTNCYENVSDKSIYATLDIKDYILGSTYAYTKGESYSEETLKAIMIILKTNALSYGGYNSSSKEIEVKSCSINNNYCSVYDGCSLIYEGYYDNVYTYQEYVNNSNLTKIEPASEDYIETLNNIYNEIKGFLYISSSYKSTISNLSSGNALDFKDAYLEQFESLALQEKNYQEILNDIYTSDEEIQDDDIVYKETLFLGDSRMQGMLISGVINNTNTVYGVGYGYNWLIGNGSYSSNYTNSINGGITGINGKMRDNASYNIVTWLGVNDYKSIGAEKYYNKYYELATNEWSNHNIYIVSVGPVDDEKAAYVDNIGINEFNSSMKRLVQSSGLSNLIYIDLNIDFSSLTYDSEGIHYSNSDYKKIYNIIISNLDNSISSNLSLYNLTDYCVYYTVTANNAYWWPIGSQFATNGNVYGGNPVSTEITSTFGSRIHPITGEYQEAHGAIDIATQIDTPVIATKDGTVNFVNKGCEVGDTNCGGGYGNYLTIDHGDGIVSLYAHLKSLLVNHGDVVKQGQIIAYSGNTGSSTGPHLHFEIRLNGTRVDPLNYVSTDNPRPVNSYILAEVDDSGNSREENKVNICTSLINSGFSKNAVAAMLVNIGSEGGFLTTNLENCYEENVCCNIGGKNYGFCNYASELKGFGSDSAYTAGVDSGALSRDTFVNVPAGYGLIQWTASGRKAGLYDYSKNQGKSIGALSVQLGYLLQELEGYATTYKYVTGNYEAWDIAYYFCADFERPYDTQNTCKKRADAYVNEYINFVNNGCQ